MKRNFIEFEGSRHNAATRHPGVWQHLPIRQGIGWVSRDGYNAHAPVLLRQKMQDKAKPP